jgi:hypothetical protein
LIGSGKNRVTSLALVALYLACIGLFVHKAWTFANAAPKERTTLAHAVSVRHYIYRGGKFNYYSYSYNFSADGSNYTGHTDCSHTIIDDALKGDNSDDAGTSTGTDATVYFDPANPSLNSLLEFSAASKNEYQQAAPDMLIGALIGGFFIFGRLLNATNKRGSGVVIDPQRTEAYPNGTGPGSEFAGQFSREAANPASHPIRELYLEVVNRVHPDRAADQADRVLREKLMKEANAAFERGDAAALRRALEEYEGAMPSS